MGEGAVVSPGPTTQGKLRGCVHRPLYRQGVGHHPRSPGSEDMPPGWVWSSVAFGAVIATTEEVTPVFERVPYPAGAAPATEFDGRRAGHGRRAQY